MRKSSFYTILIVAVCSVFAAIALFSFSGAGSARICTANDAPAENISRLGGKMLWESLSSQFVSSVQQ